LETHLFWFRAAPSARLSRLPFENDRAFLFQCWITAARIVKPVNVFEDQSNQNTILTILAIVRRLIKIANGTIKTATLAASTRQKPGSATKLSQK
jgi:hypothetical protein